MKNAHRIANPVGVRLFLPQHDFDEVQILSAAGLHGLAVSDGVFILLPQPVRPDLLVGLHLAHFENLAIF